MIIRLCKLPIRSLNQTLILYLVLTICCPVHAHTDAVLLLLVPFHTFYFEHVLKSRAFPSFVFGRHGFIDAGVNVLYLNVI